MVDLDWETVTEPDRIREALGYLGRATAKAHCVSDADSDGTLVDFQVEEAVLHVVGGREDEFVAEMVVFAHAYAAIRDDHRLFVDAFRGDRIPGLSATV